MRFSFLIIALLLSACAHLAPPAEKMLLQPAAFSDLPGFDADAVTEALPALKKSCARLMAASPDSRLGADGYAGTIADWQAPCKTLLENSFATDDDLRRFLQDHFTPYAVFNNNEPEGLFTGYYVPLLHGSTTYGSPYTVPLYARPADLITVNLGDFRPELKGQTIMGRVTGEIGRAHV